MRSVGSHSMSGREKEGIRERTGEVLNLLDIVLYIFSLIQYSVLYLRFKILNSIVLYSEKFTQFHPYSVKFLYTFRCR